jgi:predicted nucleic acid-binding protein
MSVMLDANVLTYLIVEEPELGTGDHDCWAACRELVASIGSAKVSALAWFEVYRCQLPDGSLLGDRLDRSIAKQLLIEPVDVSVAARAARLLVQARTAQQLCKRCLAPLGSKVCKSCHRTVGNNLVLNDAMIVAHAAHCSLSSTDPVTRLYTYDGGQLELGKLTGTSLEVAEPPPATGVAVTTRYGRLVTTDPERDLRA